MTSTLHMLFSGAMMHARSTVGGYQRVAEQLDDARGLGPSLSASATREYRIRGEPELMTTAIVPRVSGGEGEHGHLEEFRTDPIGFDATGCATSAVDVGIFQLADKDVVLLTGAEANEFFFRSADEDLDQAEAYPFMTPIFGKGVIFDASPERRKEMLHNSALRGEQDEGPCGHPSRGEVKKMIADWGDDGEIELLDFFAELTIYTSTACLIGFEVPQTSSTIGSRTITTTWSAAPIRCATSTRTCQSRASSVATRDASNSLRWYRKSWISGWPTRQRTKPTATCSTCWCRSRTRTATPGSPPTRSPACSSR